MDFGAKPPHSPFDPTLSEIHPGSRILLSRSQSSQECKIWIGAPQWNLPTLSKSLTEYAQIFDSIEFNASFYQTPKQEQLLKWKNETPESFAFYVKIHQDITHDPATRFYPEIFTQRLNAFIAGSEPLGHQLRGCFLQLAPDFVFGDLAVLERWLDAWPRQIPLYIEFRHPSWFDTQSRQLNAPAARRLVHYGAHTVCTDTPGRRDVSHGTLTSTKHMVRYLGQSTSQDALPLARDIERISLWAKRYQELRSLGLKEFAFFIHTPDHAHVATLMRVFLEQAGQVGHISTPIPQQLHLSF